VKVAAGRPLAALCIAAGLLLAGCSTAGSQTGAPVTGGDPQRGKTLVTAYGCVTCHQIPGVRQAGWVGPPLQGVAQRAYLAGRLPNTAENMVSWIRNPPQVDERTVMPDMNVTEQHARDIAAFLYTLR